jgi:hypothetical protein
VPRGEILEEVQMISERRYCGHMGRVEGCFTGA